MRTEQEIEEFLQFLEKKVQEYESTKFEDRPKGWSAAVADLLSALDIRITLLRWVLGRNLQRGEDGVWTDASGDLLRRPPSGTF